MQSWKNAITFATLLGLVALVGYFFLNRQTYLQPLDKLTNVTWTEAGSGDETEAEADGQEDA